MAPGLARNSTSPLYNNAGCNSSQNSPHPKNFTSFSSFQWLVPWWLYRQGKLTFFALRVYFAIIFMASAWRRYGPRRCFGLYPPMVELCQLLRSTDVERIRHAVRQLRATGLVAPDSWQPVAPAQVPPAAQAWLDRVTGRKQFLVPRNYLKALARHTAQAPARMAVLLAAQVRHLWRQHPATPHRVCFLSAAWVAKHFELKERQVHRVFAQAATEGSVLRMEPLPSKPRHAYRHGALRRFTVQPERRGRPRARQAPPPTGGPGGMNAVRGELCDTGTPIDTQMTPLSPAADTQMTPLVESQDPSPSHTSPGKVEATPRNAHIPAATTAMATPAACASGVCQDKEEKALVPSPVPASWPKPTIHNVIAQDLRDTVRLIALHHDGVQHGVIPAGEASLLAVVALAEHALAEGKDSVKLFAANVRRHRWASASQEDEDRARQRLRAVREPPPAGPLQPVVTLAPAARDPTPGLSKDAEVVAIVTTGLRAQRFRGDHYLAFRCHHPRGRDWSRARWDTALAEWHAWQHWQRGTGGQMQGATLPTGPGENPAIQAPRRQ